MSDYRIELSPLAQHSRVERDGTVDSEVVALQVSQHVEGPPSLSLLRPSGEIEVWGLEDCQIIATVDRTQEEPDVLVPVNDGPPSDDVVDI